MYSLHGVDLGIWGFGGQRGLDKAGQPKSGSMGLEPGSHKRCSSPRSRRGKFQCSEGGLRVKIEGCACGPTYKMGGTRA